MSGFDTVVIVDWSGGNDTGARPRKDAIWVCIARGEDVEAPVYLRNRGVAEAWVRDVFAAELKEGRRVLAGFDFPFAYPEGFGEALTGTRDPFAVWDWFAQHIEDAPKANNRFDVAGEINLKIGNGVGPFWGNLLAREVVGLARNKAGYENPFSDKRGCEVLAAGSFTCWQLAGAGSVGSQAMMGLPVLSRLRSEFAGDVSVWPFDTPDAAIVFVEIWPSLTLGRTPDGEIRDAWQVRALAQEFAVLSAGEMARLMDVDAAHEGWILGLEPGPKPPALRNDCFALPSGVTWMPVDAALAQLRESVGVRVGTQTVPLAQAHGRILAVDLAAKRSNPPRANSAVDGYGFSGGRRVGVHQLPLVEQTAAAGGDVLAVPDGYAVRILTGAALPDGVDTIVLQEDVERAGARISFRGPVKVGNNTRAAGEDVVQGQEILPKGARLGAQHLAIAAATGHAEVPVFERLRVGVLSTGDELVAAGALADEGQIYDANRPMLLSFLASQGCDPMDLGNVRDDQSALRDALDAAVRGGCQAILTSGGASAGDADHVSALLRETGSLAMWRIAVKPGRPLAMGLWQGVPIFGLPGNPVAALVCSLVFARPALQVMAGGAWNEPLGFMVPARFAKRKKAGRREYLRARIREGVVEVFGSEGSGRISGLAWAEGLVELPDGEMDVSMGDLVKFIPYSEFGMV